MADDIKFVVGVDYSQMTGLIRTTEQTKRAVSAVSRQFAKTNDQKAYMRGINQIVSAQKQLAASSRMSRSEIMILGNQMRQEANFSTALATSTYGLRNAQMAATKSSNNLGVATQQLGYQVSDFAVQVQSGQNVAVAFSQQASQLVGVLPLVAGRLGLTAKAAIALSAGLGIAIPLISSAVMVFMNMRNAAKESEESLDDFEDKLKSLDDKLKEFIQTKDALARGLTLDEALAGDALEQAKQNLVDANNALIAIQQRSNAMATARESLRSGKAMTASEAEAAFGGSIQSINEANKLLDDQAQAKANLEKAQQRYNTLLEKENKSRQEAQRAEFDRQDLEKTKLRYGEDSLSAFEKELQLSLDSLEAELESESVNKNVIKLILSREEALQRELRLTEKQAEKAEARKKAEEELNEKLKERAEIRRDAMLFTLEEGKSLSQKIKDQIDLNEMVKKYGEDSKQVQQTLRSQEREAYKRKLKEEENLSETQIQNLLDLYDQLFRLEDEYEGLVVIDEDDVTRANEFYDAAIKDQQELNDEAAELGRRLGLAFADALDLIKQAKAEAMVDLDAFGGAGDFAYSSPSTIKPPKDKTKSKRKPKVTQDEIDKLMEAVRVEETRLKVGEEEARQLEILQDLRRFNADADIDLTEKEMKAAAAKIAQMEQTNQKLEEQKQKYEDLGDFIGDKFEDSIMSIIDGTESMEDAFRKMAAEIVQELFRVLVLQQAIASFKAAGKFLGIPFFGDGAAFSNGRVTPFANGGVVASPTYFPMAGGNTGLMGEAGPEAIMPLKRGKDGKLGVQAEGGGTTIVNQTINVSTGVQQTVRTEIKSLMPQIAEGAKSAVLDAKRRGGSYGRTL